MNQLQVTYRQLADMIHISTIDRVPLVILGNPGLGKTSVPRQITKKLNIGKMEVLCYLFEPVDFRGLLVPVDESRTTMSYSLGRWPFARFVEDGKIPERGILLLDELLNSHRDVLTAAAEPLCDHCVNGEPLAPGWTIIATGNHLGGNTSANAMPSHVSNRVSFLHLVPDWQEWLVWATGKIRPELLGYFSMQDGLDLFKFEPANIKPNTPYLTPRSLEALSRKLDAWMSIRKDKPPLHLYSSVVGEYGGKLFATLDYLHELVSWDEIQADPTGCRMPSSPAAVYSQVQIIAGKLKSEGRIVSKRVSSATQKFIERFPVETCALAMQVWMRATTEHGSANGWAGTPEYAKWFVDNRKNLV